MSNQRKTRKSTTHSSTDFFSPTAPLILKTTFDLLWRDPILKTVFKVQLYQHPISHGIRPIGYFWILKMDKSNYPSIFDHISVTNENTGEIVEGAIDVFEMDNNKYVSFLSNSALYMVLEQCKKDIYISSHSKLNAKYKRKYGIKNRDDLIAHIKKYNEENVRTIPSILKLMKTKCNTVESCRELHGKMVDVYYERDCHANRTRSKTGPISYSRNRNERICKILNYRKNELDAYLSKNDT